MDTSLLLHTGSKGRPRLALLRESCALSLCFRIVVCNSCWLSEKLADFGEKFAEFEQILIFNGSGGKIRATGSRWATSGVF